MAKVIVATTTSLDGFIPRQKPTSGTASPNNRLRH